jgi:hypothetical protein
VAYFNDKRVSIASSRFFFLKTPRYFPLKIGATIAPQLSKEEGRMQKDE